jgi:hypothetical protein
VRGIFLTVGVLAAVVAGVVYFNFGTLSPCGLLREKVRHGDALAAVLPDSLIDLAITAQFGALSPGRCIELWLNNQTVQPPAQPPQAVVRPSVTAAPPPRAVPPAVAQPPPAREDAARAAMAAANKEAEQAANECKAKWLRGELPSRVASVRCSNPRIIQAFSNAHYRHMDLIQLFAKKRLRLALIQDRNKTTADQADVENAKIFADLVEAERRRDRGER